MYICAEEDSTHEKGSGRWEKSCRLLSQNSAVFRHSGGVFARGRPPHVGVPSGARPLARHALADSAAPLQIPRQKNGKTHLRWRRNTPYIYSDTPQPESKLPLTRCPCPTLDAGQSCTKRDRHTVSRSRLHGFALSATASRSQRHRSALPVRSVGTDRPPPTPPGRLPTQPVLSPRAPKHGSRDRCPPSPSDSGV